MSGWRGLVVAREMWRSGGRDRGRFIVFWRMGGGRRVGGSGEVEGLIAVLDRFE